MSTVMHAGATAADDAKLARDLVQLDEGLLSPEEVAARAGMSPLELAERMVRPEVLALVDIEASKSRLSGATGRAKAVRLRDRVLALLDARIDENTAPRVLIDALNAVRHVAAQENETPRGSGFTLNILLGAAPPVVLGTVVDVPDAGEGAMRLKDGKLTLPWAPEASTQEGGAE